MITRRNLALLLLPTLALTQQCQPGGVYNAQYNRCYQFVSNPAEFAVADQQCVKLGGHLVSVTDAFENSLIAQNGVLAFADSNITDFWSGANDLVVAGKWAWTDNAPWNYQNWASAEPRSGNDCASIQLADGKWKSDMCNAPKAYACAVPPTPLSTCPPPTTPAPITCPAPPVCTQRQCQPHCESEWTYFVPTDACYKVYFSAKWDDAEAFCISLNAHLASVHSEEENTFVNNMARTDIKEGKPENLAWIGMHKVGPDWVWSDGTKSDYFNWAPKQPDNPGKENCVETAPDPSHDGWYENWNNEQCNTVMRSYICKKPSIHQ